MKLKDERNPWLVSSSARFLTFPSPSSDSTSCVNTRANCLPCGHPFQSGGLAPAISSMGQTPALRLMIPGMRMRRKAQRMARGMNGFNRKYTHARIPCVPPAMARETGRMCWLVIFPNLWRSRGPAGPSQFSPISQPGTCDRVLLKTHETSALPLTSSE